MLVGDVVGWGRGLAGIGVAIGTAWSNWRVPKAPAYDLVPEAYPAPTCEPRGTEEPEEIYVYQDNDIELVIRNYGPLPMDCSLDQDSVNGLGEVFIETLVAGRN